MDVVTAGLMDIYQRLLGLKFKQVTGEVWHEDVQTWQVDDVATGENLGRMSLRLLMSERNRSFKGQSHELDLALVDMT